MKEKLTLVCVVENMSKKVKTIERDLENEEADLATHEHRKIKISLSPRGDPGLPGPQGEIGFQGPTGPVGLPGSESISRMQTSMVLLSMCRRTWTKRTPGQNRASRTAWKEGSEGT